MIKLLLSLALIVYSSILKCQTRTIRDGNGNFHEVKKQKKPKHDSTIFVLHTIDGSKYRVYKEKKRYFYFKKTNGSLRKIYITK